MLAAILEGSIQVQWKTLCVAVLAATAGLGSSSLQHCAIVILHS